ncbi:MAG TPA: YceI family protein [Alphaproteobacteria bacterium]|nr:YceI family protein [Alphaproteobacteria bacterium]
MSRLRFILPALALFALVAVPHALADAGADIGKMPSGTYQLDPNHASITFKIDHLGFSHFTGRFDKMEATLAFDSATPEKSALDVTVYPNSIDTNDPKLDEILRTENWFNVIKFPRATFRSTKIARTGPTTGTVTGDFTLLGVTHQLTLDVTLIGAGARPMDNKKVIGFSATGSFDRAQYGLSNLVPLVGNKVTLQIEAEFDKVE